MASTLVRPFVLSALVTASLCACTQAPEKPRHVLLVVIDTLRADHLSGYGYELSSSPTIDRLASVGVTFENAIAQSSWTAPSMISLLTSRYLSGDHLQVPSGIPTVAEVFQEHGYVTGAFVENPLIRPGNGYRGFDEFCTRAPLDIQATEWIEEHAGQNVFTYIHIVDPHDPYEAPEDLRFESPAPLPRERGRRYAVAADAYGIADPERSAEAIRASIGDYDAEVRTADTRVWHYLRALGDSGQREQSIVVVASDHGEGLWTRPKFEPLIREALARAETPDLKDVFKGGHGNQLYREQVHVPLIVKAPGLPAGMIVDTLVENVDIAPTLLELCGLPPRSEFLGQSLVPLARGATRERGVYSQTRFGWMWREPDGRKLIWPSELGRREMELAPELYDLNADPKELVNLAPEEPGAVAELRTPLDAIRAAALVRDEAAEASALDANADALEALGYLGEGGHLEDLDE